MIQIPASVEPWLWSHFWWDAALYLTFLLGQLTTVLRRAGMAMRSKTTAIAQRRDYVYNNWDLILVRTMIALPIFYVWRHNELQSLGTYFGYTIPFTIPNGGIAGFCLGFFADSTLDWLGTLQKIGPISIPGWLKENIPQLPVTLTMGPADGKEKTQ